MFYLDLKPDNILYRRGPGTNTIELALGDVGGLCGLGKSFVPDGEHIQCSVELGLEEPAEWYAEWYPEVAHLPKDEKSSVWALGLLLARLVQPDAFKAYETSFSNADGDPASLELALFRLKKPFFWGSSELDELAVQMLDVDVSSRPTLKEVRNFGGG